MKTSEDREDEIAREYLRALEMHSSPQIAQWARDRWKDAQPITEIAAIILRAHRCSHLLAHLGPRDPTP